MDSEPWGYKEIAYSQHHFDMLQNDAPTKKKKKKPPSKKIRDLRRLLAFKCKIKNTLKVTQGTQTEDFNPAKEAFPKHVNRWKFWKRSNTQEKKTYYTCSQKLLIEDQGTQHNAEEGEKECRREKDDRKCELNISTNNQNLNELYNNIEGAMQLSSLEDPATLLVALRHITRINHEKGNTISFPQVEAIDRIALKSKNLPTKPEDLLTLIKKVFVRRQELLDLQQIYEHFVRAHGRTIFDYKQQWPGCNVHTHQP